MTDTARSSYRVLQVKATLATCAVLLGLSALAWWSTARTADNMMTGMADGIASSATAMMPFDTSAPVFMAMWTVMMVAMMFPTIAPIVLLHQKVVKSPLLTTAFVGGYLLVWTAVGLVPLAILYAFRNIAMDASWVAPLSGIILATAGAYQFTPWKDTCQRACRSPLNFLMTHDFGQGPAGAVRVGATHGLYCLGCCWALMAVLFVVGLMNLVWMAAIAVIFVVEKNFQYGAIVTRIAGAALIVLGIAVLVDHTILEALI